MSATIVATAAANINASHRLAMMCAGEAILHAKTAGELLLKVKADLPHGEFLPWLAANCEVSERQAQRYMRAAQGKPLPLRKMALPEKSDTVADLGDLLPHEFEPSPVHWMLALHDGAAYCIEPALQKGYFFVSRAKTIGADDAESWCLTRPVHATAVEHVLRDAGMAEPAHISWALGRSSGVRAALVPEGGAA